MRLLALDTSSVACSVALRMDDAVLERHEVLPREHTRLLLPMIRELLAEGGSSLEELDAIVLGNGPGSFIGMRIAAAVAQGLAYGAGLKVVPVSSLAAVAAEVFAVEDAREVLVAQDARMGEVYLGVFERGEGAVPVPRGDERLHGQQVIPGVDPMTASARVAAGAGWQRYPRLYAANEPFVRELSDILHPRARYLLSMVSEPGVVGLALDPKDLNPAYLRQKVAEKPPKGS